MADTLMIEHDGEPKKKSMITAIIVPVLLIALSGGLGFGFSKFYVSPMISAAESQAVAEAPEGAAPVMADAGAGAHNADIHSMTVVELEPILTNLLDPADVWVRAEFSVLFKEQPSPGAAAEIQSDFLRYMKTVKLQNLEGAIGFEHILEDLNERASLISSGASGRVLVKAFIVQ